MNVIYGFLYNSNIHESAYTTMSLHYTKEGAEKAMSWHKEEKRKEWQTIVNEDPNKGTSKGFDQLVPFGIHEDWIIEEFKILP